ncbi:hypothetical protein D3C87_1580010 [compost metagenome]
MNRGVRAFKPAIEPHELLFAKTAGSLNLGLRRNTRSRIIRNAEAARGGVAIVVVGLHSPAVSRMNVAPHMVRHRSGTTLIDWPDQLDDLLGFDFARETIAAERICDLVETLFGLLPGWFPRRLQRRDVAFEQIGDGSWSSVRRNLDAAAFLDDVGEVALEDFSRLGEGH